MGLSSSTDTVGRCETPLVGDSLRPCLESDFLNKARAILPVISPRSTPYSQKILRTLIDGVFRGTSRDGPPATESGFPMGGSRGDRGC